MTWISVVSKSFSIYHMLSPFISSLRLALGRPLGILFQVPQILLKPGRTHLDSIFSNKHQIQISININCLDLMSNSLASVQKMLIKCSPPCKKEKTNIEATCFCNPLKPSKFYLEADMKTSIVKTHGSRSIHRSPTQKLCGDPHALRVRRSRPEAKHFGPCTSRISVFNSWRNSDLGR